MDESSTLTNTREGEKGGAGKMDTIAPPPMVDQTDFGVEGGRRSGFAKESRWWDIYNNEAEKVDQELIKDWRESLNGLLLFAAIFAAVLTAFIIESKKMLEEDPASLMLEVMIFYANNRSNDTRTPYEKPQFEATSAAVSINCLLFASLGASLVSALASVIALQWVADYDAAITRGGDSPLDRAKRRQFRFAGVEKWKMVPIIEALPIIVFIAVVLFFAGLIQWMLEINNMVGFIIVGATAIAALSYLTSTVIAVVSAASPFRTPPARWIYSSFHAFLKLLYRALKAASFIAAAEWISRHYPTITNEARSRDDRVIKENPQLEYDAYLWVSRQISTSQESYGRWIVILAELLNWSPKQLESIGFLSGPWMANLETISQYYYQNSCILQHTVKDCSNIATLLLISSVEQISQNINNPTIYHQDASESEYWEQYCMKTGADPSQLSNSPHPLFLLKRDLPIPSLGSASEVRATAQLSQWRNSLAKGPDIWNDILSRGDAYSPRFLETILTMLLQYIPHSGWNFADTETQGACTSLSRNLLKRSTDQALPPKLIELTPRAFGHLVCPGKSYDYPERYARNIITLPAGVKALHGSVTLILARSLKSCQPEILLQRLKEVIAMIWLLPDDNLALELSSGSLCIMISDETISDVYSQDAFNAWPRRIGSLSLVPEILECMMHAWRGCTNFGPLWSARNSGWRVDYDPPMDPFAIFDKYIGSASTAAQYHAVITILCQGLEPMKVDKHSIFDEEHKPLSALSDPCIHFLRCLFLDITTPGPKTGIKPEFLETVERLLVEDLSESTDFMWELWAFVWVQFSTRQKQKWCRGARSEPKRLVNLEKMGSHPVMLDFQYDAPVNLWCRLLEADLNFEDKEEEKRTWVTILDDRQLFSGVGFGNMRILGVLACLLYTHSQDAPQLEFWEGTDAGYIGHTWRICKAVKANRSLMLAHLIGVLPGLVKANRMEYECALVLKLLQDGYRDKGLYINHLRSLIETLRAGFRQDYDSEQNRIMQREVAATIDQLLVEIWYRGALAWPRSPVAHHPVGNSFGMYT